MVLLFFKGIVHEACPYISIVLRTKRVSQVLFASEDFEAGKDPHTSGPIHAFSSPLLKKKNQYPVNTFLFSS